MNVEGEDYGAWVQRVLALPWREREALTTNPAGVVPVPQRRVTAVWTIIDSGPRCPRLGEPG
jgi:hypothetical protein